jgi:hypothetical protein
MDGDKWIRVEGAIDCAHYGYYDPADAEYTALCGETNSARRKKNFKEGLYYPRTEICKKVKKSAINQLGYDPRSCKVIKTHAPRKAYPKKKK